MFINSVYIYISINDTSLANYISYDNFNDALRYSLDAHSPLIIRTKKYGAHSPWFNNDFVLLRRRLRYQQLKFKRSKCFTHLESFKNIRYLYKKKLSAAKSSYYTDKLNKYGTSSKEAFSLIGKNRNKKLPYGSDDNLCSLYADFFQNKVLKIIEDLPVVDSIYFESPPSFSDTHLSYFNVPTFSVVLSLMSCLKSNSTLYPIPLNLLRILSPYLIDIIIGIIRVSLSSSIVHQSMKYA